MPRKNIDICITFYVLREETTIDFLPTLFWYIISADRERLDAQKVLYALMPIYQHMRGPKIRRTAWAWSVI